MYTVTRNKNVRRPVNRVILGGRVLGVQHVDVNMAVFVEDVLCHCTQFVDTWLRVRQVAAGDRGRQKAKCAVIRWRRASGARAWCGVSRVRGVVAGTLRSTAQRDCVSACGRRLIGIIVIISTSCRAAAPSLGLATTRIGIVVIAAIIIIIIIISTIISRLRRWCPSIVCPQIWVHLGPCTTVRTLTRVVVIRAAEAWSVHPGRPFHWCGKLMDLD